MYQWLLIQLRLYSWWWACVPPETCRVDLQRNKTSLHIVTSVGYSIEYYDARNNKYQVCNTYCLSTATMIVRTLLHVRFVRTFPCFVINRLCHSISPKKVKISYFEGEKQWTFCGLEILSCVFSFPTARCMFVVRVTVILLESFIIVLRQSCCPVAF